MQYFLILGNFKHLIKFLDSYFKDNITQCFLKISFPSDHTPTLPTWKTMNIASKSQIKGY